MSRHEINAKKHAGVIFDEIYKENYAIADGEDEESADKLADKYARDWANIAADQAYESYMEGDY